MLPKRSILRQACLILFTTILLLTVSPVWAQDATPFPRLGDAPGTAAGCSELLINGGFEAEGLGWQPLLPGLPADLDAEYVTSPVFAGSRSVRLGIINAENTAITTGIYQVVTLPAGANPIALSLQLLPKTGADAGTDLQFVDVTDAITNELIVRLWSQVTNRESWLFQQYDLTPLRGRTVRVSIGVSNDGVGGKTGLYVDSVSLQACDASPVPTSTPGGATLTPTVGATPSPTNIIVVTSTPTPPVVVPTFALTPTPILPPPTATPLLPPTPLPAGCLTNVIVNGSFEEQLVGATGWILGDDPVPPRLASGGFTGLRSLRLGNPPEGGRPDVVSYSSVRQLITIPQTAVTAELLWARRSYTQDNGVPSSQNRVDRQELILLTPNLVTLDYPLYRTLLNDGGWVQERTDLTEYIGQTFFIYFNVLNDGDGLYTWMDLDDVQLTLCFSVPPTPIPVVVLPAEVSPLVVTASPTAVDTFNSEATREVIPVVTVDISSDISSAPVDAAGERSINENRLEQVTDEQLPPTPRLVQAFQQYWWLLLIAVALWAVWGFFGRRP